MCFTCKTFIVVCGKFSLYHFLPELAVFCRGYDKKYFTIFFIYNVYVCLCLYVCICSSLSVHVCVCIPSYVTACACLSLCMCVWLCVCLCVCVCQSYPMSRPCRGKLLLICNYDFYSTSVDGHELPERQGADADINNISTLFKDLQFNVISRTNLTAAVITWHIFLCTQLYMALF